MGVYYYKSVNPSDTQLISHFNTTENYKTHVKMSITALQELHNNSNTWQGSVRASVQTESWVFIVKRRI